MAGVKLGADGLTVDLPSGPAYFNYHWLRDNCSSAFDPQTRERVFDIADLAAAPSAEAGAVVDGSLVVRWAGEDLESTFDLAWLDEWAVSRMRPDPARLERRLWTAADFQSLSRFPFQAVLGDDGSLAAYARALLVDGIAFIDGVPDTDAGLTELANRFGSVRPSVAGDYFHVHVHANPVNLSYTAAALEMHTDTPAEELAPGVQFLHCRANTVAGGDSIFLDGAAVAEDFRRSHPQDFDLLAATDVPFYYEHDEFDWRSRQRVIECDTGGAVSGLTVSRHMADVIDLPQRDLDAYYPALRRFGQALRDPRYAARFRLEAGTCVVFDNHRIVHGRDAYAASTGERYLRGCYVDRGEVRSTYRTLVRKGFA